MHEQELQEFLAFIFLPEYSFPALPNPISTPGIVQLFRHALDGVECELAAQGLAALLVSPTEQQIQVILTAMTRRESWYD